MIGCDLAKCGRSAMFATISQSHTAIGLWLVARVVIDITNDWRRSVARSIGNRATSGNGRPPVVYRDWYLTIGRSTRGRVITNE